jgi:hypothetical protein
LNHFGEDAFADLLLQELSQQFYVGLHAWKESGQNMSFDFLQGILDGKTGSYFSQEKELQFEMYELDTGLQESREKEGSGKFISFTEDLDDISLSSKNQTWTSQGYSGQFVEAPGPVGQKQGEISIFDEMNVNEWTQNKVAMTGDELRNQKLAMEIFGDVGDARTGNLQQSGGRDIGICEMTFD